MTILVTGASGFIGRHLCRILLSEPRDVVALCRPGRESATRDAVGMDIATVTDCEDIPILTQSFMTHGVESVIHLAARFDDPRQPNTARHVVGTNVGFATRVAEATALANPGAVFVNAGTIWQHLEDAVYRPASLYAATKQAFEDILVHYEITRRLFPRTIIVPDTYGPEDQRKKIVPLLLGALSSQAALEASSGTGVLDLLHVRDVARGLVHALDQELGAGRWRLTSGHAISVRELHSLMSDLAGSGVPVSWGALPDRPNTVRQLVTVAPRLPEWSPAVNLVSGLGELINSHQGSELDC